MPLSDYHYHATIEATRAITECKTETLRTQPFWTVSREIFGSKFTAEFLYELSAFAVMGVFLAWPVFIAMHAVTRMVRGY